MKRPCLPRFIPAIIIPVLIGCGIQTKEVFTINPDLSGKCVIEAKMYIDTTRLGAALALKDSMYGITPALPNFHKMKFSRKDAMLFALNFIKTRGVEVWNNIHFGMSKKRDMVYFSGVAYFRNIEHVRFSMIDSALHVSKSSGGQITFTLQSVPPKSQNKISDEEADKRVVEFRQNAFYERPVLADVLNPTEATVIYNLPGKITNASILGQQGDDVVELTLTGNEVLRYADTLTKNQQLAVMHYKYTGGTNAGVMEPLFNRVVWGIDVPAEVTFAKGEKDLFDYNAEEQNALVFFDEYMRKTKLDKFDSTMMMREEKAERIRPVEYGILVVSKMDSAAKKPYFNDMMVVQSHDTLTFSGELSQDIKAEPEANIHIMRLTTGAGQDITDSIVERNKITAQLLPAEGNTGKKGPKRKVNFMCRVHFPNDCKEITVQGRVAIVVGDKPGNAIPFKMRRVAVTSAKHPQ